MVWVAILKWIARSQSATETILKLRMHKFIRYDAPNLLITDNGPQFRSVEFAEFAMEWWFKLQTSSPHYPRSNGWAEAAVQVAKSLMVSCKRDALLDVYQTFLDYRNNPRMTAGLSLACSSLNEQSNSHRDSATETRTDWCRNTGSPEQATQRATSQM